jgi:putative membrane protein
MTELYRMIKLIIKWIVIAVAFILVSQLVPGIVVVSFTDALIAALVFSVINMFIKPILKILAFPINMLTMGLFGFIINAFLFWLVAYLVPGVSVTTIAAAMIGSFVLSVILWIAGMFLD